MKNRDVIIIEKIVTYCNEIEGTCELFPNTLEEFTNNFTFRNACSMCILQIGELCKNISDELKDSNNEVQWKAWCGIRDIFAHQYSNMDYEIAWGTIETDVPVLKKCCEKIIDNNIKENM